MPRPVLPKLRTGANAKFYYLPPLIVLVIAVLFLFHHYNQWSLLSFRRESGHRELAVLLAQRGFNLDRSLNKNSHSWLKNHTEKRRQTVATSSGHWVGEPFVLPEPHEMSFFPEKVESRSSAPTQRCRHPWLAPGEPAHTGTGAGGREKAIVLEGLSSCAKKTIGSFFDEEGSDGTAEENTDIDSSMATAFVRDWTAVHLHWLKDLKVLNGGNHSGFQLKVVHHDDSREWRRGGFHVDQEHSDKFDAFTKSLKRDPIHPGGYALYVDSVMALVVLPPCHPTTNGASSSSLLSPPAAVGLRNALHSLMFLTLTPLLGNETTTEGSKENKLMSLMLATPCGKVWDNKPKTQWRGLHIDSSRHYVEVKTLKAALRAMSRLKLSVFHWHLADDQGWRIESKAIPALHQVGGRRGPSLNGLKNNKHNGSAYPQPKYYTQQEIRDLIRYAKARGITLVPEIDLPAHSAAIIAALESTGNSTLKNFGYVAKPGEGNADCKPFPAGNTGAPNCMGGTFGIMYPTEHAFAILKIILGEVCQLFAQSPFLHIGGDQAEYLRSRGWAATGAHSKEFFAGLDDLKDLGKVQSVLTDKIINEILADPSSSCCSASRNAKRTPVVWDETYLELNDNYYPPNDTHVMIWRYDQLREFEARELRRQALYNATYRRVLQEDTGSDPYETDGRPPPPAPLPVILTPKQRLYFDYVEHYPYKQNRYPNQQRPAPFLKFKSTTLKRAFKTHEMLWDAGLLRVVGFQAGLWTELVTTEDRFFYQLFPRLYALADVAWKLRVPPTFAEEYAHHSELSKLSKNLLSSLVERQFLLFQDNVRRWENFSQDH